jgi:hypothetical protein
VVLTSACTTPIRSVMHRDAVLSRPRMWTTVGSDDEAEGSAVKEKEPKQDSSSKRSSADGSESPDRERSHKKHRKERKEKKERKHKVAHAYSSTPSTCIIAVQFVTLVFDFVVCSTVRHLYCCYIA